MIGTNGERTWTRMKRIIARLYYTFEHSLSFLWQRVSRSSRKEAPDRRRTERELGLRWFRCLPGLGTAGQELLRGSLELGWVNLGWDRAVEEPEWRELQGGREVIPSRMA